MDAPFCTRFAPSPTGLLHLGHAYAALYAARLAEKIHGHFLLRFEDIDSSRVRQEFYQACLEDLTWLGIHWTEPPLYQKNRLQSYRQALDFLAEENLIYPCFCTRKDILTQIQSSSQAPHDSTAFVYPKICKNLSAHRIEELLAQGVEHCWRLDSQKAKKRVGNLHFLDHFWGIMDVATEAFGDVVIARKDIETSYHLAVVIDDAYQGITHVSRGQDLLEVTSIHRLLQALLDLPTPLYYHHPLVCDDHSRRLAKSHHSLSLQELRKQGMTPEKVLEKLHSLKLPLP